MIPIEITVNIKGIDTEEMEATMFSVVQLPCVPVNGMRIDAPNDSGDELELSGVAYCLRRRMFVGLLTDTAFGDDTESVIKSWEAVGFTCDWCRKKAAFAKAVEFLKERDQRRREASDAKPQG